MKVAAFSKDEVLSGVTGFDPANTVYFIFKDTYKRDSTSENEEKGSFIY